jgi:RHS repeat-associated protein/uncharacterized repeat protein (TIGR01451 family)
VLNGGTVLGGTITSSSEAALIVQSGTLDGVTVSGVLDVGNSVSAANLAVTNGLVLNGTLQVGSPTTGNYGQVSFAGSQTLGGNGTVVFGINGFYNALQVANADTTLTLGPGITVRGHSGTIGYRSYSGGPQNVGVINQGIISADVSSGTITISAEPFSNQGLAQAINGGTLTINNSWSNSGTLVASGGNLNLGGSFSTAGLGAINGTNGAVYLTGILRNTNSTLALNGASGSWVLNGGTVLGGTITSSNGAALIVQSGTLDGVTINGVLDVGNAYIANLTVTNGLVLNGTALVGNTNYPYGAISFAGSQTLSGNGTVVFGGGNGWGGAANALYLAYGGTTLTLGAGITVRGQTGMIGAAAYPWYGPGNVAWINLGTISADVSGGIITVTGEPFTNQGLAQAINGGTLKITTSSFQNTGTLEASSGGILQIAQMPSTEGNVIAMAGGTVNLPTSIYFNGVNRLSSQPGSTVQISGSLLGNTRNLGQFSPMGTVIFNGSGNSSSPQLLEVMGQNFGTSPLGFIHNFTYGTLRLANDTYVRLFDQYVNSSGTGAEALYVNSLVVPTGCTLDLNGLHVYARAAQVGGSVLHGAVTTIPNSGSVGFSEPTLGNLAAAGQLDEWTFFARAGQFYTVLVDPGSGSGVPPYLNFVEAKVVDTNGVVIASNTNASSGAAIFLSGVAITKDGTYRVQVHASPASPSSIGHYMVTVWPTTPNVADLVINQTVGGTIQTPYSVDQWNFVATAGQIVRFHLVNVSGTGAGFDLKGSGGWIGFSNVVADSDFIMLPTSGNYSVTAHSLSGQYGVVYAFQMLLTGQTDLPLGTVYQGQWAGSGQAVLLQFNLPAGAPMLVTVDNLVANNHCEVYARFGQPPTRSTYDYHSATPGTPNQQLLTTMATAGTWYVLVYGDNIQAPGDFTVQVSSAAVMLSSVTPDRSGRNAASTLTITGAGFEGSNSVQLVDAGGTAYPADSTEVDLFTRITATFGAGAVPPGKYSVRVSRAAGGSATLTNAFEVLTGGLANLTTDLGVPSAIGRHGTTTIYTQYRNNGDAAMPAPLLVLTATGCGRQGAYLTTDASRLFIGLWTSAAPAGFSHAIQFLGSGQAPEMLQPGESFNIPVYCAGWQQPWDCLTIEWNLGVLKPDDPTPLDWPTFKDSMRPSTIPADAWEAIWVSFTAQVGATWGDYVHMLDDNAAYLSRLGLRVVDVGQLLGFEFMQADGLTPLRTLASSVDASVPAPGLPLTFSRSFGEPISQRYALGPLGRGWAHNWQYLLQKAGDGTVTIFGPGGSQRVFQPDVRVIDDAVFNHHGQYFTQAGDHSTLTALGGGGFTLQEKSGVLYTYQSDGKLSSLEDPNGNRITLTYTSGLFTTLTHSSGQSLQITYNGAGRIQALTDHLGRQTVLSYDGANEHLTGAQYFDGRTAGYTYNLTPGAGLHALTQVTSSCCNGRYFDYDVLGRLTGTHLEGNAEAVTFGYDTAGRVTVTDALGYASKFYFDHRGLLAKTEDAMGNAVHLAFDNDYNLVSIMDPTGRFYGYGYDSRGNLVRSVDPLGHATQFSFTSAFNRLASVTDARGNATRYDYDYSGNLQAITYADGSVENWTYGLLGNPETWKNRRGHETFYTYNDNGQVTAKYFADGAVTDYAYDASGNVTNAFTYDAQLFPLESVSMTYDTSNRLTRVDYPGDKFLAFTYDSTGRRTSSVDQLGHQLSYFYDAAGRLQSMTNELNALVVLYQYDPAGRVAVKTLGSSLFATYQYDPAGQLLNLTNSLANGTVLSRFNYTYDSRGRRTTMSTLDGNWTYTYDDIGQLVHAVYAAVTTNIPSQDLACVYDAVGNRTQTIENGIATSYTANKLNQYFSVGQTNYTFDADGNLVNEVWPQGTNTYAYNDENRLVAVTAPQGTWQNVYDGLGNRVVSTQNGANKRYVVDPIGLGNVVGEYDSSGNLVTHYDHALGLVSQADAGGNTARYTFDALGNAQQLVTGLGTIANSYAYTPFGSLLRVGETLSNPFQFVGQFGAVKEPYGLSLMRLRFYDSGIGRFVSRDPIGLAGQDVNFYRYAGNNPALWIDPMGLAFDGNKFSRCLFGQSYNELLTSFVEGILGAEGEGIIFGIIIECPVCTAIFAGKYIYDVAECITKAGGPELSWNPSGLGPIGFPTWLPVPPTTPGGGGTNGVSSAGDPNQMTGPAGFGPSGFLSQASTFAYRIDFENVTNATAPAQQVIVTDQLSTNYDWSSFNVSEVGFGDLLMALPQGVQHFETNVPVNYYGTNFQVQVQVGIQPASGRVYANFRSIDPNTSLPPPVNIGFLPPEDGTGRGQGHVSYTIRPRAGLPTGTEFRNVALISFDSQPVISTDQVDPLNPAAGIDPAKQCLNTVDAVAPTSNVLPLPAQSQLLLIPVSWTGQDDVGGSGVASYDIFVSDNSGPWSLWQAATTSNNASFRGQPQHTYRFYSAARDNAGNMEAPHAAADATTTVVANPMLQLTLTPTSTNLNVDDTFTYTVKVKNIGSLNLNGVVLSNAMPAGIALDWVQYGRGSSDIGDDWILWSIGNMATNLSATMSVTATAAANGAWTNFFSVADSDGAASSSATELIQIGPVTSPVLTVALSGQQVVLSWPQSASAYHLETTTNLVLQGSWATVTNVPVPGGGQDTVTLPASSLQRFFRLRSP